MIPNNEHGREAGDLGPRRVTLMNALMLHAIDSTPCEGLEVTGWPVMTVAAAAS